ncbi:hypothetical protein TWF696_009557 [Orbilia brochopaga]|uniref:Uncharacterized protein n=1 Tax=Orbilia brochopaga TaxID=3140254 RepID=A0AAV9UCJ7_9PEZI
MPPAQPPLSLHLKSSTATFFIILPASANFATLQSELLALLTSNAAHLPPSLSTPPTSHTAIKIGLPKDPTDPRKSGFTPLDRASYRNGNGTLSATGIKDNTVIAFKIVEGDGDGWDGEFDVTYPSEDYDESQGK